MHFSSASFKTIYIRFFSLVELIIVIAVLAILMSLISPSISKFVKSSNQIVCINNFKHTVSNTILYTDDYDGYFQMTYLRISGIGTVSWDDQLSEYDGRNLTADQKRVRNLETLLYRCPEDQRDGETVNTARSMGINSLAGFQVHDIPTIVKPKNINDISAPGHTVMYGESPNSSVYGGKFYRKENTFRVNDNRIGNFNSQFGGGRKSLHLFNYPDGIHGIPTYSNYGFIDGSVQFLSLLDMHNGTGKNLLEKNVKEDGTYFDIHK